VDENKRGSPGYSNNKWLFLSTFDHFLVAQLFMSDQVLASLILDTVTLLIMMTNVVFLDATAQLDEAEASNLGANFVLDRHFFRLSMVEKRSQQSRACIV